MKIPGQGLAVAVRIVDRLPTGLERLRIAAEAENHRFVTRLRDEWEDGTLRFDGEGERWFVAERAGVLVGVGGLCRDPYTSDPSVGRVRHLYVHPEARGIGVGSRLLAAIRAEAGSFRRLRLRTNCEAAARYHRTRGFRPTDEPDATHVDGEPRDGRSR